MRTIHWISSFGMLALYGAASLFGWGFNPAPRELLSKDARQAPGGYRSYHMWHSGFRGRKVTMIDKLYTALVDFITNGFKTVLYTLLGIALFSLTYWVFSKMFPMQKEIEEDQNTALAVLMGSVMLGIAIIIAASIH